MLISRRTVALVVIAGLMAADRASAIFVPGIRRQSQEELQAEEAAGGYWKNVWPRTKKAFLEPVGGLAVNLDYRYGTEDLTSTLAAGGGPTASESKLNTFSLRPEIVWTNWLNTYAIAALHEGKNRSDALSLDLDGWAAGAGVTASFGLPSYDPPKCKKKVSIDPLFIVPDFNWTHNEFDDIKNAVNVYTVTTRIGAGARTKRFNWALYAGPLYQSSTRDLTIRAFGTELAARTRPQEAWSGVVGAIFGYRISNDEDAQERPTLQLTVEGGVGNRQGVLVSLRYEYDFLNRTPDAARESPPAL